MGAVSGYVSVPGPHGFERIEIGRLVAHYRLMARNSPRPAFWRMMARTAIRTFREQNAEPERMAA